MRFGAALCLAVLAVAGCKDVANEERPPSAREFPRAYRPVSAASGDSFSNEQARDDRREAVTVMDLAAIRPGMTVSKPNGSTMSR